MLGIVLDRRSPGERDRMEIDGVRVLD